MKTERLRELTRAELVQKRRDIEQELFNLQIRQSLQPPDNPLLFRTLRRQLARVLTILHEDEKRIRPLDSQKQGPV